jgi:peptidoglycan hydrolase-like protein with peptidoglycan-binding domain
LAAVADLTFADAAFLPDPLPDTDGFCFYIGGDTPHVYTAAEITQLKARYRYLLPIFTRSDPPGPGAAADVAEAVSQLRTAGAPAGTLVAWDSETSTDAGYIRDVFARLNADGYKLIDYGSQSFVSGNQNPDGYYWGGDWTGVPHLHPGDVMTQWVSFSGYDESLAVSSLPFWDTRAGQDWTEAIIMALPTLQQGSRDTAGQPLLVHRVQALVAGIGTWNNLGPATQLTADGVFDPKTTAGVKAVQAFFRITADGIVGQQTWTKLIRGY